MGFKFHTKFFLTFNANLIVTLHCIDLHCNRHCKSCIRYLRWWCGMSNLLALTFVSRHQSIWKPVRHCITMCCIQIQSNLRIGLAVSKWFLPTHWLSLFHCSMIMLNIKLKKETERQIRQSLNSRFQWEQNICVSKYFCLFSQFLIVAFWLDFYKPNFSNH